MNSVGLLLKQIAEAGLPYPAVDLTRGEFRRFRWPLYRVMVVIDADSWTDRVGTWLGRFGGHTSGKGVEANREKDAEALREGWTVLRVTKQMVESGYALTVIRDLIAQRKQRLRREIGVCGRDPAETV